MKKRYNEQLIYFKRWLKDTCKKNYSYKKLKNLHGLDLSGNGLMSIPPEIGQLTNLQYLNLYYNRLTSIPPEIGMLTNLRELRLSCNNLTSLPPEIGMLTNLQSFEFAW
jgi:Leucine-rich repeat (LRR) protein